VSRQPGVETEGEGLTTNMVLDWELIHPKLRLVNLDGISAGKATIQFDATPLT